MRRARDPRRVPRRATRDPQRRRRRAPTAADEGRGRRRRGHARARVAVVGEERLLEVRRLDRDVDDVPRGGRAQHRIDLAADEEAQRVAARRPRGRRRRGSTRRAAARASSPNVIVTLRRARRVSSATVSTASSRPSLMIATRSQMRCTSARLCEERKTVLPASRSSPASSRNVSCISGSSPLVGSSRISSSGSWNIAWIRPIFCRFPRESSPSGRSRSASKRSASCSARPRSAHPAKAARGSAAARDR